MTTTNNQSEAMPPLTVKNPNYQTKIVNRKSSPWARGLAFTLLALWFFDPGISNAKQDPPCLKNFTSADVLIVAHPDGQIFFKKNESKKSVPASTIKLLTALTAIHHLGTFYRFPTEFYMDTDKNLKIKGFGDPLLVSEAWQEIADELGRTPGFVYRVLNSEQAQVLIEDYLSFQDQEYRALYKLSVDAVREVLRKGTPQEKLMAARMFLQSHGKLKEASSSSESAEDVIRRMMVHIDNVYVGSATERGAGETSESSAPLKLLKKEN